MIKSLKHAMLITALLFVASPLAADPGLVGDWQLRVEGRMGVQTPTLVIAENSGVFSGRIGGDRGTLEIETIEVEGQSFTFPFTMSTPLREFTLIYSGTREGDTLTGTVESPRGPVPFTGKRK